jgi:hypothetical protein
MEKIPSGCGQAPHPHHVCIVGFGLGPESKTRENSANLVLMCTIRLGPVTGCGNMKNPSGWDKQLKPYVVGVIGHFRDDKRVLLWDLMNEPDNENGSIRNRSYPTSEGCVAVIAKEWEWARSANPSQPLTQRCLATETTVFCTKTQRTWPDFNCKLPMSSLPQL